MISRKTTLRPVLALALTAAALMSLTGCPDNSSTKPGTTPAASSAPAAANAPAAPAATPAKTGSGW